MSTISRFLWLYLLALTGVWLATDFTPWSTPSNFFAWRAVLMQYGGVLAMGVMSASMMLAVRPVFLEPRLGGLDKMYRLHKWLGIAALVISVSHWLMAKAPKWMVGWGWLERPARGPRAVLVDAPVQQFFMSQRGLAETVGEWAFYGALVLMALALVKRFPYRTFVKTHHLLAALYLALVAHSVVLLRFEDWRGVLGPVMAVLMGLGTMSAVLVLRGRVGAARKISGELASLRQHPALDVMELEIRCHGRWPGHAAGQFAFVTLEDDEGPHPYTIASAWTGGGRVTFIIKALGDYTRTLKDRLRVGDPVLVEGPYGRFNFEGRLPRQIWIGAGIGITPFIARMQALAAAPDGKTIDLFHPTAVYDAQALGLLQRDAEAAGVRLHVLWDERDGRLDAQRLVQAVPDWKEADVWFCGPAAFGRSLQKDLMALGLPASRFHQELFEMR